MLVGTEGSSWCLQRAVQKVMKRDMSDAPLHIVFSLFDANQDGNLASTELVTVGALAALSPLASVSHIQEGFVVAS